MNPASSRKHTTGFISRLATSWMTTALAAIALYGFAAAPTIRAEVPASELKLAGAIPLNTEEFGKAALAIQAIILGDAMAPPGDNDNMAKSEDKAVAANAAFVAANRARAEAIYGSFATFGL